MSKPTRRLVIVVRADPVICGHSGEARNLAEAALTRGFDDVRIVTWPIEQLQRAGLPLKPLESVLPYSDGITVERPAPVGDYKIPDGRYLAGMVGRLVELFTDGVPTVAMSLYLTPHATAISEALSVARRTGLPVRVTSIAEAVGSDITNVVRSCVDEGNFGAAAHVFANYLSHNVCVAVSEYTKTLIVEAAEAIDSAQGTMFANQCQDRVTVSYPAIDSSVFSAITDADIDAALKNRDLERGNYVLFLSRLTKAKGVDDLIEGFCRSEASSNSKLVIGGTGPDAEAFREQALASSAADRIVFFDDIDDTEKRYLMAGAGAYSLPSKPRPEFVETFGIALVEKMLAGGGPVITTTTGGIPEAVGDAALIIEAGSPESVASAIDNAMLHMSSDELKAFEAQAKAHALQFDRINVFDRLFDNVLVPN